MERALLLLASVLLLMVVRLIFLLIAQGLLLKLIVLVERLRPLRNLSLCACLPACLRLDKPAPSCCSSPSGFCHTNNKVLFLRNQGALTMGDTAAEAFFLMHQLVLACRVQVQAGVPCTGRPGTLDLAGFWVVPDAELSGVAAAVARGKTRGGGGERGTEEDDDEEEEPLGHMEWDAMCRRMGEEMGLAYQE